MISKIHQKLLSMQDIKYRDFNARLITTSKKPIIGVRLPKLRKYAKELLKSNEKVVFKDKYYEEILLRCIYVAGIKCSFDEKIKQIEELLPLIDNWGTCDTLVSSLKIINKHLDEYYPCLLKYLKTNKEYYQRYSLVVLLHFYVDEKYLDDLLNIIKKQKYNGYYSKMAAAWLLSYLLIFYFDETLDYLKNNEIDEFVYKKGIQKALDSFRLNNKQKYMLRTFN